MSKLDTLEPAFRAKIKAVLARLEEHGIKCVVTSARRTIAEQDALYAQGRTKPGQIVTRAKGGQSPHNFGLAVDLCPLDKDGKLWWKAPDDVWQVIKIVAEEDPALDSGYDFKAIKDRPHIEDRGWLSTQAAWRAGKVNVA